MSFLKLVFKPGINRDQTNYSGEGGWSDGDKIRFFSGYPQKLGGWQKTTSETFIGVCRQVWNWITSFTDNFLGVGTDIKLYIEVGGQFYDITPLRVPLTGAGDVTFAASNGSSVITVSDTAHGALAGDYVTFSDALTLSGGVITGTIAGASTGTATFTTVSQTSTSGDGYGADFTISSDGAGAYTLDAITTAGNAYAAADTLVILGTDLGGSSPANDATITVTSVTAGNITAAVLNQNYVVTSKIDDDSFTISAKNPSTGAAVTANASDTGDGGSATVGAYEIHPGYPLTTAGYGWGASAWNGSYPWGLGGSTPIDLLQRDWFMDNFENDFVANIRRGPIYYWERGSSASPATALGTRAVLLSSLSGNDSVPTLAMQVRFLRMTSTFWLLGVSPTQVIQPILIPFLFAGPAKKSLSIGTPQAPHQTVVPAVQGFCVFHGAQRLWRRRPHGKRFLYIQIRRSIPCSLPARRMFLRCSNSLTTSPLLAHGQQQLPTTSHTGWVRTSFMSTLVKFKHCQRPFENTFTKTLTLLKLIKSSRAPTRALMRSGGSTPVPTLTGTIGM
jgi:hypothetical protein